LTGIEKTDSEQVIDEPMAKASQKLIDLRTARRRSLGVGVIVVMLLALASIVVDVWLMRHLGEGLQTRANDATALAAFVEETLPSASRWVLGIKAAALTLAVLIAVAFARSYHEQISQLAESRERNRAIVDNMVDGAIHIDANGRLVALNAAAERMFGLSSKDVRGQSLSILLTPDYRQQLETKIRLAATRNGAEEPLNVALEVQGQRSNGTRFPLYLAISEVAMGSYPVFTAIARDLTETKRQIQELAEARDQALAADRAKSQFLAVMSHEIRTPMNGVMGMLDLLRDANLTQQQLEFIDTAEKSSNVLLGLINDILDLSKIEAGKLDLQELDFNLGATIEEVAALVASSTRGKDVEVVSFVESDVPKRLRGDPYRLRQVLTNLMGNAVKFTHQGEVAVHASLEEAGERGTLVKIAVRDTGIGISAEVVGKLFQPFTQADASTTRRFGGTGLGLVISKRLVEMMGGEIGVDSIPGKGSTFWFTVRLAPAQSSAETINADLAGIRILIVDDNATNRVILEKYLTQWGAKPTSSEDARSALKALHTAVDAGQPFELAILDMQMPEMDGIELAQMIKGDSALSNTPLLMLSSMGYPGEEARRAGIAISLLKPVRQALLHEAVTKSLGVAKPPARAIDARPEQLRRFNARVLLAEDNPINEKVVRIMLDRLGTDIVVAANGELAIEAVARDREIDLILMDIHMPVLNGLEATRRIRQHEKEHELSPIPIIAMTASALTRDREDCKAAGMNDFLSKPVKRQDLDTVLAQWLPRNRQVDPAADDANS
jgi:PAS domain S-box-containing protein